MGIENQPVSKVQWVQRGKLRANNYNPNAVAPPELDLLKLSIIEDGWTQPIVTLADVGMQPSEIETRLGMESEELERLLDRAGMPVRGTVGVNSFGRAWIPSR